MEMKERLRRRVNREIVQDTNFIEVEEMIEAES